jgi:ADP-ribosylglycohydrolase
VRSALWAAVGDALGFPAELADERMLQRRLDGAPDGTLRPWRRRIGGRMGPTVELPSGCTSDDTQLRLAVGRCIRGSGRFDVEAFSKIELPVFLSYELGAGRGTKTAAHALARRSTRWYANFFDARGSRYVDGGGNGAAMRIQPHVWAAPEGRPDAYLRPLLRDVVCTHGHPRALLGAALHAVAVGTALRQGAVPGPERWPGMVDYLRSITGLVAEDNVLCERWLPVWEQRAGGTFAAVVDRTILELKEQMDSAARAARVAERGRPEHAYDDLLRALGGLNPRTRGAGTITAVLALWIAWVFRDDPWEGLRLCAGVLGSDTDTTATLAGALLGGIAGSDPPERPLDAKLVASEARRLHGLGAGRSGASFPHPDPLHWHPPHSLSDVVGLLDGRIAVAGLGFAEEEGRPVSGQGRDTGLWQWLRTDFGQRLLIKRRAELPELPDTARPRDRRAPVEVDVEDAVQQAQLFVRKRASDPPLPDDPVDGVAYLAARDFDRILTSRLLEHYGEQGPVQAAVFATLFTERRYRRH